METYKAETLEDIVDILATGVKTPIIIDTSYGLIEVEMTCNGQLLMTPVQEITSSDRAFHDETSLPQTAAEPRAKKRTHKMPVTRRVRDRKRRF